MVDRAVAANGVGMSKSFQKAEVQVKCESLRITVKVMMQVYFLFIYFVQSSLNFSNA